MSSMRNAVQRRPHRERAQPLERRRLGLLEKHKDYSLRAKDYNKKKQQLKNLRQKAEDRNEDEFYFGMMSRKGPGSKLKDGRSWAGTVEGDRGNKALDMDTVRLMKTQDVKYIRTMRQVAKKKVEKLEQQVVLTRGLDRLDDEEQGGDDDDDEEDMFDLPPRPKPARKIVFLDDEEERQDVMDQLGNGESDDGSDDDDLPDHDEIGDEESEQDKSLRRLLRELERERRKLKVLTDAEHELDVQRAKMAKTATSGGETRRGHKIKVRTRKR